MTQTETQPLPSPSQQVALLESEIQSLTDAIRTALGELDDQRIGMSLRTLPDMVHSVVERFDRACAAADIESERLEDLKRALDRQNSRNVLLRSSGISGHPDTVALQQEIGSRLESGDIDDEFSTSLRALLTLIEDDSLARSQREQLFAEGCRAVKIPIMLAAFAGELTVCAPPEQLPDALTPRPPVTTPTATAPSSLAVGTTDDPPVGTTHDTAELARPTPDHPEREKGIDLSRVDRLKETLPASVQTTVAATLKQYKAMNRHKDQSKPVVRAMGPAVGGPAAGRQGGEGAVPANGRSELQQSERVDASPPVEKVTAGPDELTEQAAVPLPAEEDTSHADLAWRAVERDNLSLAYHAAVHFHLTTPAPLAVRLALLGREIMAADTDLCDAFCTTLASVQESDLVSNWSVEDQLLSLAGLLPAALSDPRVASVAMSSLNQYSLGSEFHTLRQELATLTGSLHGTSFLEEVQTAQSFMTWVADEHRARLLLEDELRAAPLRTINFAPATAVWQTFWHSDGFLSNAGIATLAGSMPSDVPIVSAAELEQRIQRTHRELGKRGQIHSGALRQLLGLVQDILQHMRDYATLRHQQPHQDYRTKAVVAFVEYWREAKVPLLTSLNHQGERAAAALGALERAADLIDDTIARPDSAEPSQLAEVVGRALLRSGIPMDASGEALAGDGARERLLDRALRTSVSWVDAFDAYLAQGDLRRARQVLDQLGEEGTEFESRWAESYTEHRGSLVRLLDAAQHSLDLSSYQGLLTESQVQTDQQRLNEFRQLTADVSTAGLHFGELQGEVRLMLNSLRSAIERRVAVLRARLDALTLDSDVARRIAIKLDQHDVQTAQEFLDYVERGENLPDEQDAITRFFTFFPKGLEAIEEYAERMRSSAGILSDLKARQSRYVPDVTTLPGAQKDSAADMLGAWFDAKQPQRFTARLLQDIVTGLGFPIDREPTAIPGTTPKAWQIHTVPVADRNIIPVDVYGSRAAGQYRVLPVWDRPSEDDLLNSLGTSTLPTLILYFGRLSQQRRRDLAARSRERRKTVLVIDEIMVMALTAVRGARLPVLFEYALPFTTFEPYTLTGSNVAPEMFYGREQEIADILDPSGASFLYGGRQLGKSALLRHIERMHHQPATGSIVRWIDLKSKEVGFGQGIEYLWTVLMRELQPFGVFSNQYTNPKPEQFQKAVLQWLDEQPNRRIVLLLDEADQFLKLDGERLINGIPAYTQAAHLKNLMETTNRRFKVVFAGTHNVLKAHRSSTSTNSPLVHLGHPIEIGPMLDLRERREAYALITEPFALLGYQFDPPDLPYRILARTNYYPSLIQIYGYHLLRYLSAKRTTLPFKIRSEHVDGVLRNRALARDIRDRLIWTLRLDVNGRYEAVAYSLAEAVSEGDVDLQTGVSVDQLQQLASFWHPDGFAQTDREEMRSVAEELKGLGILRETQTGLYAFRTPNVALMLGTTAEVQSALLDVQSRHSRRMELGEVSHRSVLPQHPTLAAPLNTRQIVQLIGNQNGVRVVLSANALNGGYLKAFVEEMTGAGTVYEVPASTDLAGFRRLLQEVDRAVSHTVYYIPREAAWTRHWIALATDKVRRYKDRSVTRFVFHGDPDRLVECEDYRNDVTFASPWNRYEVHSWLESQNLPADVDICRDIEQVTGNWPLPLSEFFDLTRARDLKGAIDLMRQRLEDDAWRQRLKQDSGLTSTQQQILKVLADAGDGLITGSDDLLALSDGVLAARDVEETIDLATQMGLVSTADSFLTVQPFLAAILR